MPSHNYFADKSYLLFFYLFIKPCSDLLLGKRFPPMLSSFEILCFTSSHLKKSIKLGLDISSVAWRGPVLLPQSTSSVLIRPKVCPVISYSY